MLVATKQRTGESADRVVLVATELIQEHGLAGFSMRMLANALGVQVGTIYWYFDDKQSLLAAIARSWLANHVPERAGSLAESICEIRRALLQLRDGADIVLSSLSLGFTVGELDTILIAAAKAEGHTEERACVLASTLLHFCLGHVVREQQFLYAIDAGVHVHPPDGSAAAQVDEQSFRAGVALICKASPAER